MPRLSEVLGPEVDARAAPVRHRAPHEALSGSTRIRFPCLVVLEGCADLYAPELSEPGGEDESDEECRTRGHPEA